MYIEVEIIEYIKSLICDKITYIFSTQTILQNKTSVFFLLTDQQHCKKLW